MQLLLDMYNRECGELKNEVENSEMKRILNNDICFPLDYQPVLSFLEHYLASKRAEME